MTRHSKVFVPVSVDIRFPDKGSRCSVITINDKGVVAEKKAIYFKDILFDTITLKDGWLIDDTYLGEKVTHWLEEKENVYVLTEDDAMFLDGILAHVEDYWHGEEGKKITEMRVALQSVYKTNPQT